MKDDFPYDRVGSWVNVWDGRDPVAGWGRLSAAFPMVLDAPVRIGGRHEVLGYFSHPAVAAVLSDAAYGPLTSAEEQANLAKRISPDWNPILLAFGFSNQLSRACSAASSSTGGSSTIGASGGGAACGCSSGAAPVRAQGRHQLRARASLMR